MMMTDPKNDMLDDLFAEARAIAPEPSDGLMARVLADAAGAQVAAPMPAPVPAKSGLFAGLLDLVGGWPSVGGLVAATITGVWVGIAPPASIEDFTATAFGDTVTIGVFADDLDFDIGTFIDG
ncbi:hypothetical protein [Yoonia sp. BS5-3]|uniref:Dihydroorotate dehydrogenase n=1 Tax=Yoonia phaeophyticola TaxID=3137369 RepID=A0ABZ2VAX7_9RHOB